MSSTHHEESGDIKATVAVLSFIFSSAAKHDVDSESLSSELQQLGLPKGWCADFIHYLILCHEEGRAAHYAYSCH